MQRPFPAFGHGTAKAFALAMPALPLGNLLLEGGNLEVLRLLCLEAFGVAVREALFFCPDVLKRLDSVPGGRIMVGLGWLATCWAAGIFYSLVGQFEAGAWRPGFGASA